MKTTQLGYAGILATNGVRSFAGKAASSGGLLNMVASGGLAGPGGIAGNGGGLVG